MTFRRLALLVVIAVIVSAAGVGLAPARVVQAGLPPTSLTYVPGQLVVRLASGSISLLGINLSYGTSLLGTLYNHPDVLLLRVPPVLNLTQVLSLLSRDPRIAFAELNYIVQEPYDGSTDRIYGWSSDPAPLGTQDATALLRLAEAHALSRGAGALVAVVDTGVQADHPALAGALDPRGFDFVSYDDQPEEAAEGIDQDGDGRADEAYGHGTHVAGIVRLVAPDASLLPIRVLNSDGRGNTFALANGIVYAAAHDADVINLSLGTAQRSAVMKLAVDEAAALGAAVVAAAGNLNNSSSQYPAAYGCALGVTAVDAQRHKASFANYGDWVSLAAPGEGIYSAFPGSQYAWWSGTSMAAPFAAGQAALLRSAHPGLSVPVLAGLMGASAQNLDAANPDYAGLLGGGLIDPLTSLQWLAAGLTPDAQPSLLADCDF